MIHLAIKFVCLLGLLSGTSLLTQARPQYVEPAIKIGVFDSEGNPIDKPKVIVYDSLHRFVKEEVVNKTDFKGQIKKIEIQNFGTYYLQFSKEGYEPIEEVRVTWKNDIVNRSPIVKMKLLNASKSLSWMWWGIGAVMLLMALQGYKIFRKKYNNKNL